MSDNKSSPNLYDEVPTEKKSKNQSQFKQVLQFSEIQDGFDDGSVVIICPNCRRSFDLEVDFDEIISDDEL